MKGRIYMLVFVFLILLGVFYTAKACIYSMNTRMKAIHYAQELDYECRYVCGVSQRIGALTLEHLPHRRDSVDRLAAVYHTYFNANDLAQRFQMYQYVERGTGRELRVLRAHEAASSDAELVEMSSRYCLATNRVARVARSYEDAVRIHNAFVSQPWAGFWARLIGTTSLPHFHEVRTVSEKPARESTPRSHRIAQTNISFDTSHSAPTPADVWR